MMAVIYAGLILLLVPFQVTILEYVSPWGVRPDLCLVAACLMGFAGGSRRGGVLGAALGLSQDLFSGGGDMLNGLTKGAIGVLSGMVAKTLSATTSLALLLPVLLFSSIAGLIAMLSARPPADGFELLHELSTLLLPQAVFDACVTSGVHWALSRLHVRGIVEPA